MGDLTSAPVPPVTSDDHVRNGDPDDPGLIIMYADFSCPRCAVEAIRLRETNAPVAFRHFALKARHPRAVALALAAEAAAAQHAFWPFHDAIFADQGRIDDPHLWALAERLGLDVGRFDADRRSDTARARVTQDLRDGMRAGVTTTPALLPRPID